MTCKFLPSALRTIYKHPRCFSFISLFNNTRCAQSFNLHSLPATCQPARRRLHTSPLRLDDGHDEESRRTLPVLMKEHTEIVWPNLFKSLGNFTAAHLIVKPYFDNDFNLSEFVKGSKQALMVIANSLARGDVDSLEGLISKEALTEIRWNLSRYSPSQLSQLAINDPNEVYLAFPYKLGIIMNDTDKGQERFVEILMSLHILPGLPKLIDSERPDRMGPAAITQYHDKIVICNYRFIREFTKGVEDQWTVNMVHHFMLADV